MPKITPGDVVADALQRCADGNWIGALRDIYGLVEGTAKAETGLVGGTAFKQWIDRNTRLIMAVATVGAVDVAQVSILIDHPRIHSVDGHAPLSAVLYHAVRCALAHDGLNPELVEFTKDEFGGAANGGAIRLPRDVVIGLILAVIGSPIHAAEKLPKPWIVRLGKVSLDLQSFWGKGEKIDDAYRRAAIQ